MLRRVFSRYLRLVVRPTSRRSRRAKRGSFGGVEGLELRQLLSAAEIVVHQTAPIITHSPVNQTVIAGQAVTFSATATGSPTSTVQWQVSTDAGHTFANVSGVGSNSTTYRFVANFSENGFEYRAVFKNSLGQTVSSIALLTVQVAPTIAINPQNQTKTFGQTFFISASVNGFPAPTAVWQISSDQGATWKNFSPISTTSKSGTTWVSTLKITPQNLAIGSYEFRAIFTNHVGSVTTAAATIVVKSA